MPPKQTLPSDQNMAQQGQELTPDQAAASLAFATKLSEQLLPKAEMPMEEMPEETVVEPIEETEKPEETEAMMMKQMDDFRAEVKEMIKQEVGAIREEIKNALSEEG